MYMYIRGKERGDDEGKRFPTSLRIFEILCLNNNRLDGLEDFF